MLESRRLFGRSFDAVKGQVQGTYKSEGKWFSGIQAFFATVKHCMGFNQWKVQQALEALSTSPTAVPQTFLRDMAATTRTAGIAEENSPEIQAALTDIKSRFGTESLLFQIKGNVTKGVLQELSQKLDGMLVELYSSSLQNSSNVNIVYNEIYALKEKVDDFAGIIDSQDPNRVKAFQQEISGQATAIGNLSEWGN